MDRQYRSYELLPIIDFIITLIWTIFWVAGSSAWAQGVTDIRSRTSYDYISRLIDECGTSGNCHKQESK